MAKRTGISVFGALAVLGCTACSGSGGRDDESPDAAAGTTDSGAGRGSSGGLDRADGGSSGAGGSGGSASGGDGSVGDPDAARDAAAADAGESPSCPDAGQPDGFHVSPAGTSAGDGSAQSPWDLATALAQPEIVTPGATIWLHDGMYLGPFSSSLTGEAANPITVRGYPGERAVLDSVSTPSAEALTVNGAHSIFQDLEVTNSFITRVITSTGSNPADARGAGVGMYAAGVKLINLVIHDTGQGVGNWSPASDGEVYGCIIFYNGWDAPDRGHGHGIYAQNQTGKKYLTDNVIFRQFSYGIHGYTEGGAIDNFEVEGNIVFNNGELSAQSGFATDILVGGLQVALAPTIRANATYFPAGEGSNNVGYSAGFSDGTITDNYFVAGTALNLVNFTGTTTVTGNTLIGSIAGFAQGDYPDNTYAASAPTGSHVIVRPNKYDPSRAHIAIFNWDAVDEVPVDLSDVLARGEAYEIVDVQDLFGAPVLQGVYAGASISVPMTGATVTTPVGEVSVTVTHTSKQFGAFLLRKVCQ